MMVRAAVCRERLQQRAGDFEQPEESFLDGSFAFLVNLFERFPTVVCFMSKLSSFLRTLAQPLVCSFVSMFVDNHLCISQKTSYR
jgi:hypothetical protein